METSSQSRGAFVRSLGSVGRACIGLGLLISAFAAFQLWGTALAETRAQDELSEQFESLRSESPTESAPSTTLPPTTTTIPTTTPDPTDASSEGELSNRQPSVRPAAGDAVGILRIPSIDVEKVIVEGVGREELQRGPGRFGNSALPGQPGNTAIAGHRTTYGAPFGDIDLLVPGDEITVETASETFTYRVLPQPSDDGRTVGHLIVSPQDTHVVQDYGDSRLTLTACHPKFSARERIVVHAELVGAPARFPPVEDASAGTESETATTLPADEAVAPQAPTQLAAQASNPDRSPGDAANGLDLAPLGWDRDALVPTLGWGALSLALLAICWELVRNATRYRPGLLVSAPAFVVALWFCFSSLDRLLPAY